jgi:rod shape-determining protein MreC
VATYRRPRSTRLLVLGLVLASLLTITVDYRGGSTGPLAGAGRAGLSLVTPLQEGVSAIFQPIGRFFSNIARAGQLRAENEILRQRLAEVTAQIPYATAYQRLYEELLQLLGLTEALQLGGLGARVTAFSPSNFESSVTVNRGTDDGVEIGQPVVAADGLVGRVINVTASTAQVLLLIDDDSHVGVRLATSGEIGDLVGQREQDLRLELIDAETRVLPGERLVTSGLEGEIFPAGIPVGEVSRVVPDESSPNADVFVRPEVDFSRLDVVYVVRGDTEPGVP